MSMTFLSMKQNTRQQLMEQALGLEDLTLKLNNSTYELHDPRHISKPPCPS